MCYPSSVLGTPRCNTRTASDHQNAQADILSCVVHKVSGWWAHSKHISIWVNWGRRQEPTKPPIRPLAASAFAGGDGVAFLRDDNGDTTAAELSADRAGRVRLVCDHRVGAGAGSTPAVAWDVDVGQDFGQHRAVVSLPTGDHVRQRPAAAVDGTVNLGSQPAS